MTGETPEAIATKSIYTGSLPHPTFSVFAVIAKTLRLLIKHPLRLVGLTATFYLPATLISFIGAASGLIGTSFLRPLVVTQYSATFIAISLLSAAVGLFVSAARSGRALSYTASLKQTLARTMPIVGTLLVLIVGVSAVPSIVFATIAMLPNGIYGILTLPLVVVPAAIVVSRWCLAIPVCAVERTGPIRSVARSAALTNGHRWQIFGLLLLCGSIFFAVATMWLCTPPVLFPSSYPSLDATLITLGKLFIFTFTATLFANTYFELQAEKDGTASGRLEGVFD